MGQMRVLRYWRLGLGAALALSVGAALAADPVVPTYPECTKQKPSAADLEGAKGAHKAASQFYDRGDYDKAIRYWSDAYGFDCTANDLLINIANAYEKKAERRAAVATLEAYLNRTGPNPTVEEKIKNLNVLIAAQPSATASASAAPTVAPVVSATVPPVPTAPPEVQRPFGITPWIVVGGGGALALIGAILLPVGYGNISSATSACPNPASCSSSSTISQGNAGRAEGGAGWGLLSVGVVAVAGGVVWQLLYNKPIQAQKPPPAKTGLWMTPAAKPGQAGMVLGGSF
jgi:hypothetical protein